MDMWHALGQQGTQMSDDVLAEKKKKINKGLTEAFAGLVQPLYIGKNKKIGYKEAFLSVILKHHNSNKIKSPNRSPNITENAKDNSSVLVQEERRTTVTNITPNLVTLDDRVGIHSHMQPLPFTPDPQRSIPKEMLDRFVKEDNWRRIIYLDHRDPYQQTSNELRPLSRLSQLN